MHLVMLSHTTSLSLTGFLGNSRHLSHKASPCMPRIGTCPRVAGSSMALTSRVWAGDYVHFIFAHAYGWRSGVHTRPHGDGTAPANVTGWV